MRKSDAISLVSSRGGEVISFGGLLAPKGSKITHKVKIGGGSFTDGSRLETGLFDFMINDEEDEFNPTFTMAHGLFSLKALTAHEYGHVWFTPFGPYKEFIVKMSEELEKEGINVRLASKVTSYFINSTEDGRIEKRMVNMFPGLINYFRYNNGTIWQLDPEEVPNMDEKELENFLRCVVTYALIGLKPKWYKNTKGTRLRTEFEKIVDIIDECISAPTCRKNAELTEKALREVWDYIVELLKEKQKDQEAMEEFLDSLADSDVAEGNEGEGDGTSAGEGEGTARLSGSDEDEDEDEDGENSPSECGDNSGAAGSTEGRETKIPEYKDISEMSKDDPGYDYSEITGDGGGSKKTIKSKAGHKSKTLEEMVNEVVTEASKTADAEATPTKTSEPKKSSGSGPMSATAISRMCGEVGYDREHIREYREEKEIYRMLPLPDELRPAATKFRRKVQKCFKEKNTVISKMSSGRLDCRQLHKVGMKEYNIFQKMANRSLTDAVAEICWDGSGSMYGGKQKLSGEACAITEEGLKGLIPLKIINFTTDWSNSEVVHYLVKDFDDNDRKVNYSTSYAKSKGFNGGNKDGYSIRVCTEDLMRRPEKDKILIVLSDGLPSDYNSINPQDDVKDAVKCARRKGIIVIPIFFGDEGFRNSALDAYEYMYEKNIINSSPEELGDRLVKLFEALILR